MAASMKGDLRWHSPLVQTILCAVCFGLTAGIYVALNSLGAGGGRPQSQHMADIAQSVLDATAFVAALFAGVLLNRFGPAFCTAVGALGYPIYVGGYWYFGENGRLAFPVTGAVILGLTCPLLQSAVSCLTMSYAEERHKGFYVGIMQGVLSLCSLVASTIPLALDSNNPDADSVPVPVYGTFVALMGCAVVLGCFILPAEKVKRADGTTIAAIPDMSFMEALTGAPKCLLDRKIAFLIPAMLSTELHLVYLGVENGLMNNSRVRALNTFIALLVSVPLIFFHGWLLDNKRWSRKARGYVGTLFVGVFLIGAFIAEVVHVRYLHRSSPPQHDWTSSGFPGELILFVIGWNAANLVLNLVTWYLGTMSNDPVKCAYYAGLSRSLLCVGQGMMFGIDASGVPMINEAGAMLAMYSASIIGLLCFTYFHLEETRYFKEDHVIVPLYVRDELPENVENVIDGKSIIIPMYGQDKLPDNTMEEKSPL